MKKKDENINIPFLLAERNNKIIHIDEITPSENGLKCNCICSICKEPLKANTLGKIKRKHFPHNINSNSFVCELSKNNQNKIKDSVKNYMIKEGYDSNYIEETVSNVLDGRLWNVEEIINIEQFFLDGKVIYIKYVII